MQTDKCEACCIHTRPAQRGQCQTNGALTRSHEGMPAVKAVEVHLLACMTSHINSTTVPYAVSCTACGHANQSKQQRQVKTLCCWQLAQREAANQTPRAQHSAKLHDCHVATHVLFKESDQTTQSWSIGDQIHSLSGQRLTAGTWYN